MLSRMFADCLPPGQDRQSSKACFPEIISTEPSSRPGMVATSLPGSWSEQDWPDGAERIRGGALSCACCGGGSGGSQPSLNPQSEAPPEPNLSGGTTRPRNASREGQQTSQLGSPSPSVQPARLDPGQLTGPSHSLTPPGEAEAGRSRAKSLNPPAPSHAKPRDRHTTSPSKLQTAQQMSASPAIFPPTYDARSGLNPVVPPSVSTPATSRRAPGEAAPKAPFARN